MKRKRILMFTLWITFYLIAQGYGILNDVATFASDVATFLTAKGRLAKSGIYSYSKQTQLVNWMNNIKVGGGPAWAKDNPGSKGGKKKASPAPEPGYGGLHDLAIYQPVLAGGMSVAEQAEAASYISAHAKAEATTVISGYEATPVGGLLS